MRATRRSCATCQESEGGRAAAGTALGSGGRRAARAAAAAGPRRQGCRPHRGLAMCRVLPSQCAGPQRGWAAGGLPSEVPACALAPPATPHRRPTCPRRGAGPQAGARRPGAHQSGKLFKAPSNRAAAGEGRMLGRLSQLGRRPASSGGGAQGARGEWGGACRRLLRPAVCSATAAGRDGGTGERSGVRGARCAPHDAAGACSARPAPPGRRWNIARSGGATVPCWLPPGPLCVCVCHAWRELQRAGNSQLMTMMG